MVPEIVFGQPYEEERKWLWQAEPVDFPEPADRYQMSMMGLEDDR